MGKKTSNFFVIHNFNTIPEELVYMCEDYIIYDCSTDEQVKKELHGKFKNVKDIENTGHNITSYFSYFDEYYDELPEVMCLLKGNMVGRHVSKEFLEANIDNGYFTFLYDEKQYWEKYSKFRMEEGKPVQNGEQTTFLGLENVYVEKNNAWYVDSENHPKKYFNDPDDLLRFIYKNPMIPSYYVFSPGACFIVRREQIRRHSRVFWRNLNKIMNYGMNPSFPSEAHQIERLLPILFTSVLEVNEWMEDEEAFGAKLPECSAYIQYKYDNRPRRFGKIRKFLGMI